MTDTHEAKTTEWTFERTVRNDLLPCPFCGDTNVTVLRRSHPIYARRWQVVCENPDCDCLVATDPMKNIAAAILAWNNRRTQSGPTTTLETLDPSELPRA